MKEKKPFFKRRWVWMFIAVLAIGGYGASQNKGSDVKPQATITATSNPTKGPTVEPTIQPTEVPTVAPTLKPTAQPTVEPTPTATPEPTINPTIKPTKTAEREYVLNTSSMKFHFKTCNSVDDIDPGNKKIVTTTRDKLIAKGYKPCKRCNP